MSIHFWKYVKQRYDYLNWRLCGFMWAFILADLCGLDDYLWTKAWWLGVLFTQIHLFSSILVLLAVGLALYALFKITRYEKRARVERYEREMARLRERQLQQMREYQERMEEARKNLDFKYRVRPPRQSEWVEGWDTEMEI